MKSDEMVTEANIPEVVTGARMKLPYDHTIQGRLMVDSCNTI